MNWHDFLQVLRVRAVEESEAPERVWDAAVIRAATLESRGLPDAGFLSARAARLTAAAREPGWLRDLGVPSVPSWARAGLLLAAFVAGWWLAALGQDREINLLALPLIAILAWNAGMILLSLFHGAGMTGEARLPGWLRSVLERRGRGNETGDETVRRRFRRLAWPPALRRAGYGLRAWLHLGAAMLALGGVAGMYARGWSTEYRAVWESTLLGEGGARAFFGALFAPASKVSGIPLPLDQLAGMRRSAGAPAAAPGSALPWIHLYSVTLALFVIVPRILLAFLEGARARRVPILELQDPGWRDYLAGIRAAPEAGGVTVAVIAHGLVADDAAKERWRRLVRTRWGDAGGVDWQAVASGAEPEFLRAWEARVPRVLLVFNLSATPEVEVHRALVEGVLAKLRPSSAAVPLILALDDTELRRRWSGFADADAKLAARVSSWREVMRGLPVDWL